MPEGDPTFHGYTAPASANTALQARKSGRSTIDGADITIPEGSDPWVEGRLSSAVSKLREIGSGLASGQTRVSTHGPQMILNGDFEDDINDWGNEGGFTNFEWVNELTSFGNIPEGFGALYAKGTAGGGLAFGNVTPMPLPSIPNVAFRAKCEAKLVVNPNSGFRLIIRWLDGAGAEISTTEGEFVSGTGRVRVLVEGKPPPGAVSARLRFYWDSNGSLCEGFFDAVEFGPKGYPVFVEGQQGPLASATAQAVTVDKLGAVLAIQTSHRDDFQLKASGQLASAAGQIAAQVKLTEIKEWLEPPPAADVLSRYARVTITSALTTLLTIPAGRTWVGVLSLSCSVYVAAGSTAVGQALGTLSVAGTGVTPAAGDVMACNALAGPNATAGLVGTQGNNSLSMPFTVIAPAGNAVTIDYVTTNTGNLSQVNIMAVGRLL